MNNINASVGQSKSPQFTCCNRRNFSNHSKRNIVMHYTPLTRYRSNNDIYCNGRGIVDNGDRICHHNGCKNYFNYNYCLKFKNGAVQQRGKTHVCHKSHRGHSFDSKPEIQIPVGEEEVMLRNEVSNLPMFNASQTLSTMDGNINTIYRKPQETGYNNEKIHNQSELMKSKSIGETRITNPDKTTTYQLESRSLSEDLTDMALENKLEDCKTMKTNLLEELNQKSKLIESLNFQINEIEKNKGIIQHNIIKEDFKSGNLAIHVELMGEPIREVFDNR